MKIAFCFPEFPSLLPRNQEILDIIGPRLQICSGQQIHKAVNVDVNVVVWREQSSKMSLDWG